VHDRQQAEGVRAPQNDVHIEALKALTLFTPNAGLTKAR
jgi:hypothetical protein